MKARHSFMARCRHPPEPLPCQAGLVGHRDRRSFRVDGVDHLGTAKRVDGPSPRGHRRFRGATAPPRVPVQPPSDLRTGPVMKRCPGSDPATRGSPDDRNQVDAANRPAACHEAPGVGAGSSAAVDTRGIGISTERRGAAEIALDRRAQDRRGRVAARLGHGRTWECGDLGGGRTGASERAWVTSRLDRTSMRNQEMMPGEGFEPPTFGLQNRCTTTVLTRQGVRRPHPDFRAAAPDRRPVVGARSRPAFLWRASDASSTRSAGTGSTWRRR